LPLLPRYGGPHIFFFPLLFSGGFPLFFVSNPQKLFSQSLRISGSIFPPLSYLCNVFFHSLPPSPFFFSFVESAESRFPPILPILPLRWFPPPLLCSLPFSFFSTRRKDKQLLPYTNADSLPSLLFSRRVSVLFPQLQ